MNESTEKILTLDSRAFLDELQRKFNGRRLGLLEQREVIQARLNEGELPDFLKETESIRNDSAWKVSETPKDLMQRWVEITGPVERKMMINALNSGADVFMADFEDSLAPTWQNVIEGQVNLMDAVHKKLYFTAPDGKQYRLNERTATLVVRPRGWHLIEKHYQVDGEMISAALFDFGLYFFHNASALLKNGTGPYFYLPKMENSAEAQLWADVFAFSENYLKIPSKSIKATVLIETILAAFEMEEILYTLKDYAIGLNAGRWDYMFSIIKKFAFHRDLIFPDRGEITMETAFMRAYAALLIQTCHKRNAHAMGGMAAFIPNRKDPELNAKALKKVESDKLRESSEGFDGTWVAHPDLVPVARKIFETQLLGKVHQKKNIPKVNVTKEQLLEFKIPNGNITIEGLQHNISSTLVYLAAWFKGIGAVAIHNLMEDTATAEIARSQIWQWIHHGALITGKTQKLDLPFILKVMEEEKNKLPVSEENERAFKLLQQLVEREAFTDFLTWEAYQNL